LYVSLATSYPPAVYVEPASSGFRGRPVIGILSGVGPNSTATFVDLVFAECRKQYGALSDIDFPPIAIVSQSVPQFQTGEIDRLSLETSMLEGVRKLHESGASFVALACNRIHHAFENIPKAVSLPVLSTVDATLIRLPAAARRIAIVASRPLAESGLYQQHAAARGFEVVEPDWQSNVDELQAMAKSGVAVEAYQAKWQDLFGKLGNVSPVDAVVVASLDLSNALRWAASPVPMVDAGQALAHEVVRQWLVQVKGNPQDVRVNTPKGAFVVSSERSRMNVDAIHQFLCHSSYWAKGIPREQVFRAVDTSLCFGVFTSDGDQVGFTRVVTDHVTFAYLCDVYVLEQYRGIGLGTALVQAVVDHPGVRDLRRVLTATRDAQNLYGKFGFRRIANPEFYMVRANTGEAASGAT